MAEQEVRSFDVSAKRHEEVSFVTKKNFFASFETIFGFFVCLHFIFMNYPSKLYFLVGFLILPVKDPVVVEICDGTEQLLHQTFDLSR